MTFVPAFLILRVRAATPQYFRRANSIRDEWQAEDAPIVLDMPQRISHRLSQLTFLSLSGNPLTRVPHFVCSLTQLETLSLEGLLFVTALPVEMGCLSNLTELHLTTSSESKRSNGAVMISPPPEILRAASKRAVLDSATRRILRIGTAGIVVQYLRMIDNAKRTRRLYLSNMGLCDFPPELQLVVGENLHPVRDKVSQQVWREKMHKTFTEPLQDLLALEYFQISNNMLTRLSPALAAFNQLRVLIADCNRIAEFPTELVWLTRLEELSAANNRLKAIPESIGKCEMLVRVNMRQNIIETVPKSVGKCVRLQTLDLAGNNIQDLPVSLGYCKNLRMINVAQNRLDSLPDVLFDLTRLETLVANGNSIVALPDNLGACRALSQLLLSCNNLQRLPLSLGHLTRLGVLCTEQNPMLLFPPVEIIALGVAKLRAFMNRFISAERSRRMLLSCMWIEQFPLSICNHHDLIFIDLSHNALKDIPNAFEAFLWLQTLQLQHNRLRILPSSICRLSRLTSLCINNNNLRDLPSTLVHLDRFQPTA
jgi:Leucine-rich repeat (LRR) protein